MFMAAQVPRYVVLLFLVCLWVQTCHGFASKHTLAGDSLKPGGILNHTTQLCSATNMFCMDFHKIDEDSDLTFLRIIYLTQRVITWIGNGNTPVVNNSGFLTLDHNGSLKIMPKVEEGKPIKVLYSPSQPTNNTLATILDNGNFVLLKLHPNGSTKGVLWQSFDYPTDKLAQGIESAVDKKGGHNWSLVSSISDHNLASSDFKELPRRFLSRPIGGGPGGSGSGDQNVHCGNDCI